MPMGTESLDIFDVVESASQKRPETQKRCYQLMVRLGVAGRAVAQPRTSAMCVVCDMQAKNNLGKLRYTT